MRSMLLVVSVIATGVMPLLVPDGQSFTAAAEPAPLSIETQIPLGDVHGRIDHLAIDSSRHRLYVAELGNDSVGVVDLQAGRTLRTLTGLKEPQGIAYDSGSDTVYIANAGDGSLRLFRGPDLVFVGQISLGEDADNVRIDEVTHRVLVGYGSGALAVIDPSTRLKVADVRLKAHPESFQLQSSGRFAYVNVPDAGEIAVVDRTANAQTDGWTTRNLRANYPMVFDEAWQRVIAVFRHPAKVGVFRAQGGALISSVPTCGDADDLFLDAKRDRLYVVCGEGFVDVLDRQGETYRSIARVPTESGARTGLFVPQMDRLVVAVRSSFGRPAAIWVFRPVG